MRRLVVLVSAAVLAAVLGGTLALAQEDVTLDDLKEAFGDLTRADVEAMGYQVDTQCVTSADLTPEEQALFPGTGGMGYHAWNETLFDDVFDPLQPEMILLDADDNVIAIEYEVLTADIENPTVAGRELRLIVGGHEEAEFDHYMQHVWLIDNPAGQFADFNPDVSCSAAALPTTGSGGYPTSGAGSGRTLLPLLAGIAGAALLAGGWALRRRTAD